MSAVALAGGLALQASAATPAHWSYTDANGGTHAFAQADACDNVTDGGTVGNDVEGCANPTFQPPTLVNLLYPGGGSGALEYIWMTTGVDPASGGAVSWSVIPGSTAAEYTPDPLTKTAYFMRCTRRAGCDDYAGESNYVTVLIDCCDNVTDGGAIAGDQRQCGLPYDVELLRNVGPASGGSLALEYTWLTSTTTDVFTPGDTAWTAVAGVRTPYYNPGEVRATTYFVRAARREFCEDFGAWSNVVTVEPFAIPTLKADVTDATCFADADGAAAVTILNAATPFTAAWLDNGSTDLNRTGMAAGTYVFEISDGNGCVGSETITIAEPEALRVVAAADFDPCAFVDATLTAPVTGGTKSYSYRWNTGATTSTVNNQPTGTYAVTVTDDHGCVADTTVVVDPPAVLTATETHVDPVCYLDNGSVAVAPAGGVRPYTYTWSPSVSTDSAATDQPGGEYTIVVTDANACTTTLDVALDDTPPISIAFDPTQIRCGGQPTGAIDATVSGGAGGYTFLWSNGATTEDVRNLRADTFELKVTDANGCEERRGIILTEPEPFVADVTVVQPACAEDGGTLTAVIDGGTAPYDFSWLDQANTPVGARNQYTLTGVPAGNYTLSASDAAGCFQDVTESVDDVLPLVLRTDSTDAACPSDPTGTATVIITGGEGIYGVVWSDTAAQTTETATGLAPDTYTATVTDARGCVRTASVLVNAESTGPLLDAVLDTITCFSASDGAIDLTVTGGVKPYGYSWADGPTSEDRTDLAAGTYEVTVTDAKGCEAAATYTLTEPEELVVTTTVTSRYNNYFNVSRYDVTDGRASVAVTGGTGTYTYAWSNGSTSAAPTNLPGKMSYVEVTDANGCTVRDSAFLEEPSMISDFAWEDTDGDGIQDADEPGIAGVNITLTGSDFNGRQVNFTTSTDAEGLYRFDQLPKGSYFLLFQLPNFQDYLHSPVGQGSDSSKDSDMDPVSGSVSRTVTAHCQADYDTDAGYIPRSSVVTIGDEVWYDQNHDGRRDQFEQVLQGVTLRLVRATDGFLVGTTVSNEDGRYAFSEVAPGTYYMEVVQSSSSIGSSFVLTFAKQGADEGKDSDFDPATKRTELFTVTAATQEIMTFDAGLHAGCGEVDIAGSISSDEQVCKGSLPNLITSVTAPTAPVSYQWIRSASATYRGPNDPSWSDLPGASGADYQPSNLVNTVHYIRLARVTGCADFTGASNVVTKTAKPVPTAEISSASGDGVLGFDGQTVTLCKNGGLVLTADSTSPAIFYWNFGGRSTPRLDTGRVAGPATFDTTGVRRVNLYVEVNGCRGGDSIQVNVINSDCATGGLVGEIDALAHDGSNEVTWSAFSVATDAYFEVERADQLGEFHVVDIVQATAVGEWSDYRYDDRYAPSGRIAYRVTQREAGMEPFASAIATVMSEQADLILEVYPNPTSGTATLELASAAGGRVDYELLNAFGKVVRRGADVGGRHTLTLDDLPAGSYYLRAVSADGSVDQRTLVKQ